MSYEIDCWCRHCHRLFYEAWGGGGFRGLYIHGPMTFTEPPLNLEEDGPCLEGCCPECQNTHGPRAWICDGKAWFPVTDDPPATDDPPPDAGEIPF
jgi:hypothetical protein